MEGTYYRYRTADACLKEEVAVVLLSCSEEDIAFFGDELLVRGRNALTLFEAGLDESESRLDASHALRNGRYLVVIEYIIEILGELVLIGRIRKISQIEDILDIHFCSGTFFDTFLVLVEKLDNAGAYNTVT